MPVCSEASVSFVAHSPDHLVDHAIPRLPCSHSTQFDFAESAKSVSLKLRAYALGSLVSQSLISGGWVRELEAYTYSLVVAETMREQKAVSSRTGGDDYDHSHNPLRLKPRYPAVHNADKKDNIPGRRHVYLCGADVGGYLFNLSLLAHCVYFVLPVPLVIHSTIARNHNRVHK